jgi:hypothetical protein
MGAQRACPRVIVSRQVTSKAKRGIRLHSTAFSLSPFDANGPLSHTSSLSWRVRRWPAPRGANRGAPPAMVDGTELWVQIN